MSYPGDNPYDDGLDFVGCPPKEAELRLPKFPENFEADSKLICWARHLPFPDGEIPLRIEIKKFEPSPTQCGVFRGFVQFFEPRSNDLWYEGELEFYYTRNYFTDSAPLSRENMKSFGFRFVVKGSIVRCSDKMPEWDALILCTKKNKDVPIYEKIFVYGGLDLFMDTECEKFQGFLFNLGHNDGWYTHHPKCSKKPIDWHGYGDYIGHYCERGWLFVAPGKNFRFDPAIKPPTGRFTEEALREVGKVCHTEEAIRYGSLDLRHIRYIHHYQELRAYTECGAQIYSTDFCPGMVYSGERHPWLTFFSMGYWQGYLRSQTTYLHLVEGNTKISREGARPKEFYFYGFATQNYLEKGDLKLVDMADNKGVIGEAVETYQLLYLFNVTGENPRSKYLPIAPEISRKLYSAELKMLKSQPDCPFGDK